MFISTTVMWFLIAATLAIIVLIKLLTSKKQDHELLSKHFLDQNWSLSSDSYGNNDDSEVSRFEIKIPKSDLKQLQSKLQSVRWPVPSLKTSEFRYGVRDSYMKELVDYWKNDYSWKKQEDWMNSFDHFKTKIEGLNVHFIHSKPKTHAGSIEPRVLLMTHGWPGSVVEFLDIIPMLTDPGSYGGNEVDAFIVICPSIPGFGFSDSPEKEGFTVFSCARVFHKLMLKLGYKKYYVHGGDWGSAVSTSIALLYPSCVKGIHTTMSTVQPRGLNLLKIIIGAYFPSLFFHPSEISAMFPLKKMFLTMLQETGYFHLQSTKPDTVGFALSDSPVGLAAYLVEKFSTWTDLNARNHDDGMLNQLWTKNKLLNNIMVYWWNNNVTSSMRFYKENIGSNIMHEMQGVKVRVPAGFAHFSNEFIPTTRGTVEQRFCNLLHYTYMKRGGHFSAYEVPSDLATDIRLFVSTVEGFHNEQRAAEIEAQNIGVSQLDRVKSTKVKSR